MKVDEWIKLNKEKYKYIIVNTDNNEVCNWDNIEEEAMNKKNKLQNRYINRMFIVMNVSNIKKYEET